METTVNYANSADGRALGAYPLSIATSLAIESAVGVHPDLPKPRVMPIRQYKELWVNLRTLYRNVVGAMSKDIAASIHAIEIAQIMLEEMYHIPDILQHESGQPVKVVYYFNNMKYLVAKYPEASLRTDNTPRQQQATQTLGEVMHLLLQHHKDMVVLFDDKPPGNTVDTLIITNIAYDLLWASNFGSLTLLESHTGKIKTKPLWYTKYYSGKELSQIPFTEELLQVFGDTETFHPMDVNLRKAIIELAARRNWSSLTTRARIVEGIGELKNGAHVLKMKKVYKVLF